PPRVVNFTVNGQKSVYLRDDDNADFFCEVDGIPTPTAYLNGSFLSKIHDLSNSSHIVSSSLTSVSCEDSGRYFCYGRNGRENTSSFEADYVDINVTCKPRLLPSEAKYENESKVVRISVDTNTVFTVIIYGYPAPTQFVLKVEKDNVFQNLSVHHEVTYTKLTPPFGRVNVTIYDANTKETKTYNLNIKNEAGMVDIKFNVIKEETIWHPSDDVGMKVGVGVGVGLGVLLLAAVIIVTVCIVRKRRLNNTPRQPPPQFFNPTFDKPEFHRKRQINLETDYIN
ncbi:hypothetical protein Bpfe_016927, partial [Biomphalaria pfeifferi]